MAYMIYHNGSTSQALSGRQYNPIGGTARLNLRTGTKSDDILEYGFTTDSSASEYGYLKFRINEQDAWIGRSESSTHSCSYNTLTRTEYATKSYTASYSIGTAKTYSTKSTAITTATLTKTATTATHTCSSQYTTMTNSGTTIVTTGAYTRTSQYTVNAATGSRVSTSATLTRSSQYTVSTNSSSTTITTASYTYRASTRLTYAGPYKYSEYNAYCRSSSTYSTVHYNTLGGCQNPYLTSSSTQSSHFMPMGSGITRSSLISSGSSVNGSIVTMVSSYLYDYTYNTKISSLGTSSTAPKASYYTRLSSISSTGTVAHYSSVVEVYSTSKSTSAYGTSLSTWRNYVTSTRSSISSYGTRSSAYTTFTTSTRTSISSYGTSLSTWYSYTSSTRSSISGYATGTSITGYGTLPNYTISETTAIHSLYTSMSSVSSSSRHNFNV